VAGPGGRHHRATLELLEAEFRVLSAGLDEMPSIEPPAGFSPVAGRVLHIVWRSLPTTQVGYTIRTHSIAVAQVAAGLDPHVVTELGQAAEDIDARTHGTLDGVTYHSLPGTPRGSIALDKWLAANIASVASVVSEVRPAVLHAASDYVNALTARALGDAFGVPVVYESRGFWEETGLARRAHQYGWDLNRLATGHGLPDVYLLQRDLEDRCRREADRVVTLSGAMADRIEAGGVDRQRIAVVPNAVDVQAFPVLGRNHDLAARLGIPDETTVIGYISTLSAYEGVDTLIDAFAAVHASGRTRLALLIVGDGREHANLKRQAAALGLTDAIFPGRVPHKDILDYYSLIDIFVVPRKPVELSHLVTPLKPFEAFATGRTVVMSDVRALAAIAEESQAAMLFTAGSAESLAATLTTLLDDEGRRKDLATAGAAWVRAHRTWAANAERYVRLYAEMGAMMPTSLGSARALRS
jgi:glycosyltransferase involved in cell wall biosynthesis